MISARHTTVNLLRTMEDVLGIAPMGLNDGLADPMADVFDTKAGPAWSFEAHPSAILRTTKLPLPPADAKEAACMVKPRRSAAWWAAAMAGQDFSQEDRLNTASYNQALWRGLRGAEPYPSARNGADLRAHREQAAGGRAGEPLRLLTRGAVQLSSCCAKSCGPLPRA